MITTVEAEVDDRPGADDERGAPGERPPAGDGPGIGGVLVAVAALAGFLTGIAPLHDNSFLTHLATGRLIIGEGGIPRGDPFSFTAPGEPWVVQSWLATAIYALVEDLAGFAGIRVLQGLLGAAIAVAVWALTSRSPSLAVRVGLTGVVVFVMGEYLAGRPLMFGILGLLLVFLAAEGRFDPRWLLPVMWVWVNTHGSFPLAVVLVGALAVGRRLDEGAWGPEVRVGAFTVGGIALGAVNPLGLDLITFPALLLRRTEAFQSVLEWQRPDYSTWSHFVVAGMLALGAVLCVRRFSWRAFLPLAGFGVMGLTAQRNQLVLLLVLAPVLAGLLPEVGPAVADVRRAIFRPARLAVVGLTVVFGVVALQTPHVSLDAYPEGASVWMDEAGLWGPDSRVMAPDFVGNLREAQAGRDARVFFDDRVDMYPLALVRDFNTLNTASEGWEQVVERYAPTAILWDEETPFGRVITEDPAWEVVHRDAPWVVLVPVSSP